MLPDMVRARVATSPCALLVTCVPWISSILADSEFVSFEAFLLSSYFLLALRFTTR